MESWQKRGSPDAPVITRKSNPAYFISAPKWRPELDFKYSPVTELLVETVIRPEQGALVPFKTPVTIIGQFAGSSRATPFGTRS